jgi:hemolysin activation/secretion protein
VEALFTNACRIFAVITLWSVPVVAVAQVIPPSDQPGRERQLFIEPQAPQAQPGGEVIALPSTVAPAGAANVAVFISAVEISGSTVYSADDLALLYQDLVGREGSLQSVYDLAQRITAKYGNDGYVLSRAIVPPQQLNPKGAVIRIQVVEGWISHIEWPAQLSRYRDFFSGYAAKIVADRPANIRTMERYLLLAGDLPGLKFSTSLKPDPQQTGASILVVEVSEKPIDATARLDNRGTAARGPVEYLGAATLNNLAGQHEALTLTWAGAIPLNELQYVAGAYRQVLTSEGLTFFADGSDSWGTPGTAQLEALQYRTLGPYGDAGLSYPVIRSRERNLTLSGLFFASNSESYTQGAPFNDDRLRGFRAKADADFADRWLGINQFNLTFSQGIEGLGSTENGNPLASRAAGRVNFDKIEATASRTQPLFDRFSVYVSGYGQYGFTPLLVPEQCSFGGRYFGRAFDPSQLLGDRCIEAIGELRYDLPAIIPQLVQAQLYGFADYGELTTLSPAVGTPGNIDAASAGVGLRLGGLYYLNLIVDLQLAKAIEGPLDDWRFFFIVAARY